MSSARASRVWITGLTAAGRLGSVCVAVAVASCFLLLLGHSLLASTVGQPECRPMVDCKKDPTLCAKPAPCGAVYHPMAGPTNRRPAAPHDTNLKMLEYLQARLPVYLTQGTHLGAIRNGSLVEGDYGDIDVLVAPRYGDDTGDGGYCMARPSLSTQWWWNSVVDEVAAVIRRDLPDDWVLYTGGSAYDLQLSLTPRPGEPLKCCRWPHSVDINIETHCRQQERVRTFGKGFCQCWLNGVESTCVEDGPLFAECMYGGTWATPKVCTFSVDHPFKDPCKMTDRSPKCAHLSYFECPAVLSYKYRHLHGGGD